MHAYKQEVRTGLFHLKEAVLDVLLDARNEGQPLLQPKDIRKRLGIPAIGEADTRSSLILGVLYYLNDEERVQCKWEGTYKWYITEKEALLRSKWSNQ